jgi:hypothetical protein
MLISLLRSGTAPGFKPVYASHPLSIIKKTRRSAIYLRQRNANEIGLHGITWEHRQGWIEPRNDLSRTYTWLSGGLIASI